LRLRIVIGRGSFCPVQILKTDVGGETIKK
jgi:hypothetical protein